MPDVDAINAFIQDRLAEENLVEVTAVQAAQWLHQAGLLRDSPSRRGLPLRNLLREARILGQRQEISGRWFIRRCGAEAIGGVGGDVPAHSEGRSECTHVVSLGEGLDAAVVGSAIGHACGGQDLSAVIYKLLSSLPRYRYPVPWARLPDNGVYVFFETGETAEIDGAALDRIVRVGTHRQDGRFRNRIANHFSGNKNGSVFRKHLGTALIRKQDPRDSRLRIWIGSHGGRIPELETAVTDILRSNFSFCCFRVDSTEDRISLERGLIALLAQHPLGVPSGDWLGGWAQSEAIRRTGLWNVQCADDEPLTLQEFRVLEQLVAVSLEKQT